ncbi:hypothetical protein Sgou_58040 [Streptomyces gougerotii]|uniref:Uncharacterized protein n=2 Tax=Streptomyces diastaticus group TaxID=2849069 RepID=A0A8H9HLQ8_9ACTN|nr:hypothetical protein Sgou_58040 [Streptomyces gougerotii]GGU74030.1 hypothetical protein GCM10010227_30380 [Streptomyces gougerotii]
MSPEAPGTQVRSACGTCGGGGRKEENPDQPPQKFLGIRTRRHPPRLRTGRTDGLPARGRPKRPHVTDDTWGPPAPDMRAERYRTADTVR